MSEAFRKLAGGFKLVYIGLIVIVLAVVVGAIGGGVIGGMQAAQRPPGQPAPPPAFGARPQGPVLLLTAAVGAVALIGGVLGLVGRVRCLAVPDEVPGARGMITGSVALEVIALLISLVNNADQVAVQALPPVVSASAGLIASVFNIAAAILFLLFTAAVARYIRREQLAQSARTVLILYVVAMVLALAAAGSTIAMVLAGLPGQGGAGGQPPNAAMAGLGLVLCGVGCGLIVVGLIALVMYARLLTGMSEACLRYADDPDAEYDDDDRRDRRGRRDPDDYDRDDYDR